MKKTNLILALLIVASVAISGFTISYFHANGSEVAMTNSPHDGSGDCTNCHHGGSATPVVSLTASPAFSNNTYVPGTVYTITYKVTGYPKFGFDLEMNDGNTTTSMGAGSFTALTNSHVTANPYNQGYPANVSQSAAISSSSSATFKWTAPTNNAVVYLYSVGLGANGNGSTSGDKMVQYNLILNPAPAGSAPVANFSANNTTICAGQSVSFTDLSTHSPTSWTWTFAGGTPATSTTQNPTITYSTPGTYAVSLTATNTSGSNTKNQTGYITVNALPVTPTVSSNTPVCVGGTINLTTPTVVGATYSWSGPGGFTSTTQNASRTNATTAMSGVYSLTETVNGCTSAAGSTTVNVSGTSVTPSVSITITSGSNPTCNGQSVTFTATPTNGGSTPTYQWKLNGNNVGTNSATYTSSTLTNGSVVSCVMTSSNGCASPSTATSSGIIMSVSTSVAPTVAIAITNGGNPTCNGQSVTFTATPTNGGSNPSYQWKINGSNVGTNSATYTNTSFANNSVVTCVMTSNSSCASPSTATSNSITMSVTTSVAPAISIAITSGTNPSCNGQAITFTATPTNGGNTPSYHWKLNGSTNVGTDSPTYITSSLANNDVITCIMTSNSSCASPLNATSNSITMSIGASQPPSVVVALTSGSNPTCSGQSLTFTATPTNGGSTPSYQWQLNGNNVGTNSSTYTHASFQNGDVVSCNIVSSSSCASPSGASSNGITISIATNLVPLVAANISTGSNPTCAGDSVTFTAAPTNGGATPTYQWSVNGNVVGSDSVFMSSTLADGDAVTCVMTSSSTCVSPSTASSTPIIMSVSNGTLVPSISIDGQSTICDGQPLVLTATAVNGGATPGYQWKINGVYSDPDTNSTFIYPNPSLGDIITCVLTSSSSCANPTMVVSNVVTVTITNTAPPVPYASFDGTSLMSSATSYNQWFYNGTEIPGATDQTFIPTQNGSYQVGTSNGCAMSISDPISITTLGVNELTNIRQLNIYPNPAHDNFILTFLVSERTTYKIKITSLIGQTVYADEIVDFNGTYSRQLDVKEFGSGVYSISISDTKNTVIKKLVVY